MKLKQYISIDVGGTSIKYGLIDENGMIKEHHECDTEAWLGGPSILEKMKKIVGEYKSKASLSGICISTAGMVDCEKGEIFHAGPQIPHYKGTKIKKTMEEFFCLPCEVENDVNCAGLAENFAGESKGSRVSLCLTVGTGIGGCIVIDNHVFHGFSGSACEVGYMHMLGSTFQELGASSVLVKKVAAKRGIAPKEINGRILFEEAKNGNPDCISAIEDMTNVLGMGIANICYVLNPEIVVLGGGIMAQKNYLYERIRKSMDHYLIESIASKTRLAFAKNQNQAGMLGAFYHFKQRQEHQ